jgi:hypothetical protein
VVERPIKKSERPQKSEDGAQQSVNQTGNRRGKGKGRRGGRGRDDRDRKPAVPPALMRGPKPQKPKFEEEETSVESNTEDDASEAAVENAEDVNTATEESGIEATDAENHENET